MFKFAFGFFVAPAMFILLSFLVAPANNGTIESAAFTVEHTPECEKMTQITLIRRGFNSPKIIESIPKTRGNDGTEVDPSIGTDFSYIAVCEGPQTGYAYCLFFLDNEEVPTIVWQNCFGDRRAIPTPAK